MKMAALFGLVLGALSAAADVIVTKPGREVTFDCGVTTYTRSLKWQHGDTLILSTNEKSGFHRKGSSEIAKRSTVKHINLKLHGVKEEDAGKFTCSADGRVSEHVLVVASVSASPSDKLQLGSDATLQCRMEGLTPGSKVQWKRPDGSPHGGAQVVHLQPVARSDAGRWRCTFSHGGEEFGENLEISVAEPAAPTPVPIPEDAVKPEPPCVTCVTNPPSDADLLLGLSWWMWIVIGVGGVVVVLLMVFVICLCKRIKRKKRRLHKMKNAGRLLMPKKYCQCNRPTAAAEPQRGRRREKPSAPPLQPLLME